MKQVQEKSCFSMKDMFIKIRTEVMEKILNAEKYKFLDMCKIASWLITAVKIDLLNKLF